MTRKSLLYLGLVAVVLLPSCGGISSGTAATVNGHPISEDAVRAELADFRETNRYKQLAKQSDVEQIERDFLQGAVAQLVRRAVLTPLAAEHGVEITDADVDSEMENIKADFPDDTAFREALKEEGLTEEKLRELVRDRLIEQGVRTDVTGGLSASEEDVRAFYEEHANEYKQTCSRHILVAEDGLARVIASELQQATPGELEDLFTKLAAKHSQDTSNAKSGGDLGCNPPGQFVPEFEQAMDALEIGEVSDSVQTQFGFHVILVTDRGEQTYEDVRDQIFEQLTGPMQDEAWADFMANAYQDADIELNSRYGVIDLATGQVKDPTAKEIPGGQAPKATEPEEPLDPLRPGDEQPEP